MSDLLTGVISGSLATILGFVLLMAWDQYKYNRDVKERERTILRAVLEEIKSNIKILNANASLLTQDNEHSTAGRAVVNPLDILRVGFWDLIKVNLPNVSPELYVDLCKAADQTESINQTIVSRENYRIGNEAMTNYVTRRQTYNNIILESGGILLETLKNVSKELGKMTQ